LEIRFHKCRVSFPVVKTVTYKRGISRLKTNTIQKSIVFAEAIEYGAVSKLTPRISNSSYGSVSSITISSTLIVP